LIAFITALSASLLATSTSPRSIPLIVISPAVIVPESTAAPPV